MTRAALAAARRPAEETYALAVGNRIKQDTNLVIPISATVAFDPSVIVACLVLADRTTGAHTMLCCTRHLSAVRAVWSALSTQCTVNLEDSNALSTRSNGHSALSAIHLTGTECSVRASCVVPCARELRRPPWDSLSLSLPLTRALPRLDLPVSVLACDVRKPFETFFF